MGAPPRPAPWPLMPCMRIQAALLSRVSGLFHLHLDIRIPASCSTLDMGYKIEFALNRRPIMMADLVNGMSPPPLPPKGLAAPLSVACVDPLQYS